MKAMVQPGLILMHLAPGNALRWKLGGVSLAGQGADTRAAKSLLSGPCWRWSSAEMMLMMLMLVCVCHAGVCVMLARE
eukprot:1319294-Rhodomonas_salina.1